MGYSRKIPSLPARIARPAKPHPALVRPENPARIAINVFEALNSQIKNK